MSARDTSIESYQQFEKHSKKEEIFNYLRQCPAGASRRMIARELGFDTATVPALVTILMNENRVGERMHPSPCQVTGRNVYWVYTYAE